MKNNTEIINLYVALLRKVLDSNQSYWTDWNNEVKIICNIDDGDKKIDFIIDALYLLEDTQLAKENYFKFDLTGPTKYKDFGEIYLRMYGIYNACYLQKQAIYTLIKNIISNEYSNISQVIDKMEIFEYRKIFASHTTNVDDRKNKNHHSYILSRHDLVSGRIMGYTSNKNEEVEFKDGLLYSQIEAWDCETIKILNKICEKIIEKYNKHFIASSDKEPWDKIFDRIQRFKNGTCYFSGNIFDLNSIEINFHSVGN